MPTILKSTRKGKRSTLKNGVDFSMYQEKQRWFEQTAKRDQETKNKSVSFLGFSWKIGLELACEQQTHFLSSTTGNASAVRRLVWRMEPTCEGIGKREAVGWGERGGGGGGSRALYECAEQTNKLVLAMNFGSFIVFFVIEILKLFEQLSKHLVFRAFPLNNLVPRAFPLKSPGDEVE